MRILLISLPLLLVAACSDSSPDAASPTSTSNPSPTSRPSVAPADCDAQPVRDVPYREIEGVDPMLLSLDVAPVAGRCGAPVVVWVHGGGWRIGDRSNGSQTRADFYTSHGWVLVSVNYRLTTQRADPAVRYPDHNEDVAAALSWVHDEIADHGGDPSRVLLVGHSAGAGIAAAVVADPRYLDRYDVDPSWLSCVVLLDTAGYDVAAAGDDEGEDGIYRGAFGDDPAVWADASPTTHVGSGPLPRRALVVTRGSRARIEQASAFSDQLLGAGVQSRVVDANPLSHAEVNKLIGSGDAVMTPLLTDELAACAGP